MRRLRFGAGEDLRMGKRIAIIGGAVVAILAIALLAGFFYMLW
jgi:hypothetical protein